MSEVAATRWVERAGRAGYAAKGVLYGLIGLIAIQVPIGLEEEPEDRQGALRMVGQPDENGLAEVYYRPPKTYFDTDALVNVLRSRLRGERELDSDPAAPGLRSRTAAVGR